MTKCVFVANGKRFKSYAEARKESKFVDIEYIKDWINPAEAENSAKILAEHKKAIAHLNTPELCKKRLVAMGR